MYRLLKIRIPPKDSPSSSTPQEPFAACSNQHTLVGTSIAGHTNQKSKFLIRHKVLYVGDSIANNANFNKVERESNVRIRTVKAYSSAHDDRAKWPRKNMTNVTPAAIMKKRIEDEYTQLVLGTPTVEVV